jgi:hypothetical protein
MPNRLRICTSPVATTITGCVRKPIDTSKLMPPVSADGNGLPIENATARMNSESASITKPKTLL